MKLRRTGISLVVSFLMLMFLSALSCTIGPALFATPTPTLTPTSTSTPTPTTTPTPTVTPTPIGGAGWIVFASRETDDDNSDIYAIRVDGSETRQITNGPGNNWAPDLSPDGRRIVFVSDRNGHKDLYLINFDGSGLTRLTYTDDNIDPKWSPDGRSIAFVSARSGSRTTEIWTVEIGTAGMILSTLTLVTYDEYDDYDPAWSPDGNQIVYASFRMDGGYNLFITNRAGSQTRQLTDGPHWDRSPHWSPDGQSILFTRWLTQDIAQNRNFWIGESWDERMAVIYSDNFEILTLPSRIAVIGSNGSGLREVTSMTYNAWAPCWSPDGRWLAFASDRNDDSEIYVMPADMREERSTAITRNTFVDSMPSWGGPRR